MRVVIPLSKDAGPVFRQIYLRLRESILAGAFRPGDRLPATRDLAEQLHVSRTVILLAYEQLLAEGFVEGRAGSGTYVSEGLGAARSKRAENAAIPRLSRFGSWAAGAVTKIDLTRRRPTPLRYDFAYGLSAVERFPFETWRRILMRRARQAPLRTFAYGVAAGSLSLREAIAAHLRRSRGVACDASQVIVVNGSQQALDLTARVLLERGDRVAIENPHYLGAREVFQASGARLIPVPVDRDGLNPARLPGRARIVFVTPSHQFPTGAILPLARRLALLDWARRAGAIVIEDDYDGEFHYEGQPVESMQGLDAEGRVIYVGTFSRTVFPALRIGYLVAPKSLVPALTASKWLCDRHTATLEQETLAEFIATGAYERHLRRARRANALRRDALLDAIQKYFGDRVSVTGSGSGTHVALWPRKKRSEEWMIKQAASRGVGIQGLSRYYLEQPAPSGVMLAYARAKPEEIREGIRRLAESVL